MAERLADVLKKASKAKWAFFHRVATTRNPKLLAVLDMGTKGDTAVVTQLMKLFQNELKKANLEHVTVLLRVIRVCFVDSESVMKALVAKGIDKLALALIAELRKTYTGVGEWPSLLEQVLAISADMFEWDFFASSQYANYIEELLNVLAKCDDCDGCLFAESANVLMSMCTTDISRVATSLLQSGTNSKRLGQLLHEIPRAKSFYYEALLLELAYRLRRHMLKSDSKSMKKLAETLISSFPIQIARCIGEIKPKSFREQTRSMLNEFNSAAGVIKSFQLGRLKCISNTEEIPLEATGWIDIGGVALEIEILVPTGGEDTAGVLKLPYKRLDNFKSRAEDNQITVILKPNTSLADVAIGISDAGWACKIGCRFVFKFDSTIFPTALKVIEDRVTIPPSMKTVYAESRNCGQPALALQELTKFSSKSQLKRKLKPEKKIDSEILEASYDEFQSRCDTSRGTNHQVLRNGRDTSKAGSTPTGISTATVSRKCPMKREPDSQVLAQATDRSLEKSRAKSSSFGESKLPMKKIKSSVESHATAFKVLLDSAEDSQAFAPFDDNVVIPPQSKPAHRHDHLVSSKPTSCSQSSDMSSVDYYNQSGGVNGGVQKASPVFVIKTEHQDTSPASLTMIPDEAKDITASSQPNHVSFRTTQQDQFQRLQQLVDQIVQSDEQFRQYNLTVATKKMLSQGVNKLKAKSRDMESRSVFLSSQEKAITALEKGGAHQHQLRTLYQAMEGVLDHGSSAEEHLVQRSKLISAGINQSEKHEWKKELERVQKKVRTQIQQRVAQASEKLQTIERSFNTNDLMMMQQMLQRI